MKSKAQFAVLSVLLLAVSGAASANTESVFPSDAEASYDLPALDTYADRMARAGIGEPSEVWGVGRRAGPQPHDAFPFGGGPVDD